MHRGVAIAGAVVEEVKLVALLGLAAVCMEER